MANWTSEMDFELEQLHKSGVSFANIAILMSGKFKIELSRNACIGRSNRLFMPKRGKPVPERKPREPKDQKITIRTAPTRHEPYVPSDGITIYELRDGDCRYPVNETAPRTHMYCGGPAIEGYSWCKHHKALVFRPFGSVS